MGDIANVELALTRESEIATFQLVLGQDQVIDGDLGELGNIEFLLLSDAVIASFHLISPDADQISVIGPPGPPGTGGTETFTDLTDTPADYTGAAGKLTAVNAGESGLEFVDPPPPSGQSRLISGGSVIWLGTDFMFTVSAAVYLINGVQYNSPDTDIELADADPTDDRIDVIAVDDTGSVVVITGEPGGPPVEPQIDPASQLKLTFIYVTAGTTEPPGITNEEIYHENTEYTSSTNSGNFNLASTNNPRTGTKDIEATTAAAGNYVQLLKPSGTLDLSTYSLLVLYIRSKAAWPKNKSLSLFWMSGATNVGAPVALKDGVFSFDSSNTTTYQLIAIPVSLFSPSSLLTVDRLRIAVAGGGATIGFYLDDIFLQAGTIVETGVTKFLDLTDTPSSYAGQSAKIVSVKTDETGLEFTTPPSPGVDQFIELTDVPASYTGEGEKIVAVKADESGLEFIAASGVDQFTDLTDTPASYTGEGEKLVSVKADESGLEFIDPPAGGATSNQQKALINFGAKLADGLSTGTFPFASIAPCNATIIGWWARCDTDCTIKFRKANAAEPGTGDRINSSGLSLSSGITTSTTLTDFITTTISVDDVIIPEVTSISGTLTTIEVGLIVTKDA